MKGILIFTTILSLSNANNITLLKTINVKYYNPLTTEELLKELNINKNYTSYEFNILPTYSKIGINSYYLYLLDFKNNLKTYEFIINVIDDIPPNIYGPDELFLSNYSLNDTALFLNHFHSYDEVDKNLSVFIEETNFKKEIKDSYYIKLYSVDFSNNIAKKTVKIHINKDDFSLYVKDNLHLTLYKNTFYEKEEIISILQNELQIERTNFDEIEILENSKKTIYYTKTGLYDLSLLLKKNKNETKINIKINVIDKKINKESQILKWIKEIFFSIINYIKKGAKV